MTGSWESIKKEIENELFNSVIPFWEKYSIDKEDGGYFNCIDSKGIVFDTTKYMWLHGRQSWMFSKLYNTISPKKEWLDIAFHGLDFMKKHAVSEKGEVFFSLNKKGKPTSNQGDVFSECFYCMALAEYGKATQNDELITEAKQVFQNIWSSSLSRALENKKNSGKAPLQGLAEPMIMLNIIEEVYGKDYTEVSEQVNQCIEKIKIHFVNDIVYENVLEDGTLHDSAQGRILNPGHAIEAGWFLFHWSEILNDKSIGDLATSMIRNMFDVGWDKELGGIFYMLDANNHPPLQPEWNMKLWWPHCEGLYAFLLLYSRTKDQEDYNKFLKIKNYCYNHFSEKVNGEWYGHLNYDGTVSSPFKGGPFKGCFHVPRALLYCLNLKWPK